MKHYKYCYRISKYDPKKRDSFGRYIPKEWTSYHDIGKTYSDVLFTLDDYLKTENEYISAFKHFFDMQPMDRLIINGLLFNDLDGYCEPLADKVMIYLRDDEEVHKDHLPTIVRLILREQIWCILMNRNIVFEFGYDYYMYCRINLRKKPDIHQLNRCSNLFIEELEARKGVYEES